ncbi:MAG: Gfo/Idh/MocA family protein [Armatimonadota bacterium]
MGDQKRQSRRDFLRTTAAAVGFPAIIPAVARGADGSVAPSNRVVMGFIGVGSKGTGNLRGFLGRDDVQVVGVCDVDRAHRERAKELVDEKYGNEDCRSYLDFRELIGRGDIDAIGTALPDHWHAIPAIAAARAGIDVYGEKPLARSIRDGRAMVSAVERYARVWQTGSQQRSGGNFHHACELVRNGRIGKVSYVEVGLGTGPTIPYSPVEPAPEGLDWEFWLGPAPWRPYRNFGGKGGRCHWNWRWILDYSGGKLTDWAGHHIDVAHWGLGLERTGPVEIEGKGEYPIDGLATAPTFFRFTLKYASGVEIVVASDVKMGVTWYGEDGTIFVTRRTQSSTPKGVWDEAIGPDEIRLYRSPEHKRNFIECVKTRRETVAPAEIGHRSISAGLLGEIAMLTGRRIRWDPDREEIIDDPGAAALLGRAYREPWQLPA